MTLCSLTGRGPDSYSVGGCGRKRKGHTPGGPTVWPTRLCIAQCGVSLDLDEATDLKSKVSRRESSM